MSNLREFKDEIASLVFGMTVKEAHEKGICIYCREPWASKTTTESGKKEYSISALCEVCFDLISAEEKENESQPQL